jgi:type I restriction enzyme S subunit
VAGDTVYLRDLLAFTRDGEWGPEAPVDGCVPYRVIRGGDFPEVRRGNISSVPTCYLNSSKAAAKRVQPFDIIIETAGGNRDRPTGRTLLITERLLSAFASPVTCASFSRLMRINAEKAQPEYVFWYLQYLFHEGEMWQHQVQHTGLARFQFTRFAETVLIPLPQRGEQRAIVHILGALDDKIELNRRMNQTLEALARAIFNSWFVDFDPVVAKAAGRKPVGMSEDTARLFPDSFEDSPLGPIPKGWRVGRLGEIADNPRRGVNPADLESETPYIGLEHMPRHHIALDDWAYSDGLASNKFRFQAGEAERPLGRPEKVPGRCGQTSSGGRVPIR